MKSIIKLLFLVASLAIASESHSQDAAHQADHDALRAMRDKLAKALCERDIPTLHSCFADEFVFTVVDQTVVTSEVQLRDYYARMFDGPDAILTSMRCEPKADVLTRFASDNVGYCYGSTVDTYTLKDGRVTTMNTRWTAVVIKQNGEWKVAAVHDGVNFLDNPVLTRVLASSKKMAIGASIGGLILGIVLMAVIRRRPKAA